MVRILGEDPEAGEDAAMSPSKRWTGAGQSIVGRSPSSARSRSLNKVRPMPYLYSGLLRPVRRPPVTQAVHQRGG